MRESFCRIGTLNQEKEYLKSWQRVANPCSTDGIDLNEHKVSFEKEFILWARVDSLF